MARRKQTDNRVDKRLDELLVRQSPKVTDSLDKDGPILTRGNGAVHPRRSSRGVRTSVSSKSSKATVWISQKAPAATFPEIDVFGSALHLVAMDPPHPE